MTIGAPTETPTAERDSSGSPVHQDHVTLVHGRLPGDVYVRRPTHLPESAHDGHEDGFELRPDDGPGIASASVVGKVRRKLIGTPIPSDQEHAERLGVATGLPVFASDNISSSAYATEEIMRVLVLAGAGALALTLPITFGDRRRAGDRRHQLPADDRGLSARRRLVHRGQRQPRARWPALTAAGALLVDYVLTVAVSIAAGVAALTSIFPALFDIGCWSGSVFVLLIMLGNLRGIRESGAIFTAPTYVYLASIFGLLGLRAVPLPDRHAAGLHGARPDGRPQPERRRSACCSSCARSPRDRWR